MVATEKNYSSGIKEFTGVTGITGKSQWLHVNTKQWKYINHVNVVFRTGMSNTRPAGQIWLAKAVLSSLHDNWALTVPPFQQRRFCQGSGEKRQKETSESKECYWKGADQEG